MATPSSSIRIPEEVITQYDDVARATGRSRNSLMIDALRDFISAQAWFVAAVERGVVAADRGEFVPEEDIAARWDRWTGE